MQVSQRTSLKQKPKDKTRGGKINQNTKGSTQDLQDYIKWSSMHEILVSKGERKNETIRIWKHTARTYFEILKRKQNPQIHETQRNGCRINFPKHIYTHYGQTAKTQL